MESRILESLERIEWEHGVDILYACESGSRAWGFASPNSDYDVRFIYVHPESRYLSISRQRDVIEQPIVDELDVNGWDLRKALLLMRKSNPSLMEWLHSPLVYRMDELFVYRLRQVALKSLDRRALFHHYSSMARHDWRKICSAEETPLKRYFYVLRTALCALWTSDTKLSAMPPVPFQKLVEGTVRCENVRTAINELLHVKAVSTEKCSIPRVAIIDDYLSSLMAALEHTQVRKAEPLPETYFDQLFLETLRAG